MCHDVDMQTRRRSDNRVVTYLSTADRARLEVLARRKDQPVAAVTRELLHEALRGGLDQPERVA